MWQHLDSEPERQEGGCCIWDLAQSAQATQQQRESTAGGAFREYDRDVPICLPLPPFGLVQVKRHRPDAKLVSFRSSRVALHRETSLLEVRDGRSNLRNGVASRP